MSYPPLTSSYSQYWKSLSDVNPIGKLFNV